MERIRIDHGPPDLLCFLIPSRNLLAWHSIWQFGEVPSPRGCSTHPRPAGPPAGRHQAICFLNQMQSDPVAAQRFLFQASRQQLNSLTHTPSITAELHTGLFTSPVNPQLWILPLGRSSSKIFYFLVKIKRARSVTISVCLLKACRQVEGIFLNILTKTYYITCSYFTLTFPKHSAPALEDSSAPGCKPGQTQSALRNLPGQLRKKREKFCEFIRNTPASSGCFKPRLFSKAIGGLKSNAVPSTTKKHRAQSSCCEKYRNIVGSNVLFFPHSAREKVRRASRHKACRRFPGRDFPLKSDICPKMDLKVAFLRSQVHKHLMAQFPDTCRPSMGWKRGRRSVLDAQATR